MAMVINAIVCLMCGSIGNSFQWYSVGVICEYIIIVGHQKSTPLL